MELDLIPGNTIKDPTPEQIRDAIQQVYSGMVASIILFSDDENQFFIQAATGGRVEYKEDDSGLMYAAGEVPIEKCVDVFLDYATKGVSWKGMLPWEGFTFNKKSTKKQEETPSKYTPVRDAPKWKLGRLLLAVVLSVICTLVGFCLFISFSSRLEPNQFNQWTGEIFVNILWFSLAGIGWAIYRLNKLWKKSFLFLLIFLVLALTAIEMWFSGELFGIRSVSFLIPIILCGFSLFTIIKGLILILEFERDSVEVQADHLCFMRKTASSEYGASDYASLNYVFLDQFNGWIDLTLKQEKEYKSAMLGKRLRVFVRYLPRDPKLVKTRIDVNFPSK